MVLVFKIYLLTNEFNFYSSELDALKSKKARHDFLKQILIDAGLKSDGKMTIAACKRLKAKRDKAKEIAELDVGNIIESTNSRATRSTRLSSASCKKPDVVDRASNRKLNRSKLRESGEDDSDDDDDDDDENGVGAVDFSRIKDLIESDESDSTNKKEKKKKSNMAVSDSE